MKKTIKVDGMTCSMCAKTIENSFKDSPYVEVKVNVSAGKVLADYDDTQTSLQAIANTIQQAGYHPVLEDNLKESAKRARQLKIELWLSVVLSAPLALCHVWAFGMVFLCARPRAFHERVFPIDPRKHCAVCDWPSFFHFGLPRPQTKSSGHGHLGRPWDEQCVLL